MTESRRIRITGYQDKRHKAWQYRDTDYTNDPFIEWDGNQPWSKKPMSSVEEDYYEALEGLYPLLKGRQKQIVEVLQEGIFNQSEIGRRLKIARKDVVVHLRRIANKLKKIVRSSVVSRRNI